MEWSFSVQHLVKIFRKLKLIKNYHFYLYVPAASGSYLLVVLDSTRTKIISTFNHNWLTVIQNVTGKEQFLYLDTALLEIVVSMSIAESLDVQMTVDKSVGSVEEDSSFFVRVGNELVSSQSPVPLDVQTLLKVAHRFDLELADLNTEPNLPEMTGIITTISEGPYDIERLILMDGYLYFVNTGYTRISRLPVAHPHSDIELLNPFDMNSILSGLFIYEVAYVPDYDIIQFQYGMSKTDNNLSVGSFYVDTVELQSEYEFTAAFDNFKPTHKTTVTREFLSSLKKKADEGITDETVPFLTFNTTTKLQIRDLSWLLGQRRHIDIAYQSDNSLCKIESLSKVEALFTLYSQLETN